MSEKSDIVTIIRKWMEAFTIRSMHEWASYVKSTGLSIPKIGVLMFLYHRGGCGVHDIGERMETTSAAASQLIDRLVHDGLLERSENPDDRRVRKISLTEKGRTLVENGIRKRNRWVDDLAAALAEEERAAVLKALPTLMAAEKKLDDLERRSARPRSK